MRHRSEGCRSQGGFTLVEVAVVALILAMLIGLVSGLLKSGSDASKLAERTNHATEIAQDLAEQSSVITLSDWIFEAAQMRLAMKAIHVSKQKLGRRAGQQ